MILIIKINKNNQFNFIIRILNNIYIHTLNWILINKIKNLNCKFFNKNFIGFRLGIIKNIFIKFLTFNKNNLNIINKNKFIIKYNIKIYKLPKNISKITLLKSTQNNKVAREQIETRIYNYFIKFNFISKINYYYYNNLRIFIILNLLNILSIKYLLKKKFQTYVYILKC